MSIRRVALAFEREFVQMPNVWARDERLSRRARGLLVELMSHRVGWSMTVEQLVKTGGEGRSVVQSMIAELEAAGYLQRVRVQGEGGKFQGIDYVLSDPHRETENATVGETDQRPIHRSEEPPDGSAAPKNTRTPEHQNTPSLRSVVPAQTSDRPKSTTRGTRIPDDFAVTAEMVAWAQAEAPGVDGRAETAAFVDYWRARAGREAVKLDWPATWRNWMRRATPRGAVTGRAPSKRAQTEATLAQLAAEDARHDRAEVTA